MDTRSSAGTFKCSKALPTAFAPFALLALVFVSSASAADEPAKAPAGSNDGAIWVSSYCLGQAMARGLKFKDLFVANSQLVKALQAQQSGPGAVNRTAKINELEVSALYLSAKVLFLSSEMEWMSKLLEALGQHVENPDPKILNEGVDRGKTGGNILFNVESRCQSKCVSSGDAPELGRCVDSCAEQENHTLFGAAKECDHLYQHGRK